MAFKPYCEPCRTWHTEQERHVAMTVETAKCSLCAKDDSPMFYTGCMIRDGASDSGWQCDGNLTRPVREPCAYCGPGKSTGLPGNACENCMNTGLANPTAEDLT